MKMKIPFQIPIQYLIIAIAAIIIAATATAILLGNGESDDDTIPPELEVITKDISVNESEIVTIEVNFSDNIEVTEATLYYKKENENNFLSKSIISKKADIKTTEGSGDDWVYYVTVNDQAGNGPVGDPSINGSKTYKISVIENDDNDDSSDNETKKQYVFLEECSYMSCANCPAASEKIHELFESEKYDFYYVSLLNEPDFVPKATERIEEFKILGYPTIYVDGGYKILMGGGKEKNDYINAIQEAHNRERPEIYVDLTVQNESGISIKVEISNEESEEYKGTLKVYLTEIKSTNMADLNGDQYHYAFFDYAINEAITVQANDKITKTKVLNDDSIDPENLQIFAVVFSNEKHTRNSDQNDFNNDYEFDAYFADGVDSARVVEGGNFAPNLGIINPKIGRLYIFGNEITQTLRENTILIGQTTIIANASDDETSIEKVELYINDELKKEFEPESDGQYEYDHKNEKLLTFKNKIKFIAYDTEGKTSTAELEIIAFTLKA